MKRRLAKYALALMPPLILGFYAHWLEPIWIDVTHHTILAAVQRPLKIAHLSDLHIHQAGVREKYLLELLQKEAPDIIAISGDSIEENGNYPELGGFLKQLKAPLGVWITRGNWEHWRPSDEEIKIYSDSGVHFLNNASKRIREDVWITGLDDSFAGDPDMPTALSTVPTDKFKLGIVHSPENFEIYSKAFDLVLAGHTHGGQIRLPLLPPLWLPEGSGNYIAGWYQAKASYSKMYVSRGIGNSILEARFLCRPELPIITIKPRL